MIFDRLLSLTSTPPEHGAAQDFGFIRVDMHSHLLPGLDDGAERLADSEALICELNDLGFETLWTTPHVMSDTHPNSSEQIGRSLESVKTLARGRAQAPNLFAAGEYFLDAGFRARVEAGEVRCLPGRRVLVEWSLLAEPMNVYAELTYLLALGYVPVIAHPERYRYWAELPERWLELRELGCELQVNLTSLGGSYGKSARKMSTWLLAEGKVDLVGTDCHRLSHVDDLRAVLAKADLMAMLRQAPLKNQELMCTSTL